jgi:hypothetical protein
MSLLRSMRALIVDYQVAIEVTLRSLTRQSKMGLTIQRVASFKGDHRWLADLRSACLVNVQSMCIGRKLRGSWALARSILVKAVTTVRHYVLDRIRRA